MSGILIINTALTILVIILLIFNFSCVFFAFVKGKISFKNLWFFTGISTLILLFIIKLMGWI